MFDLTWELARLNLNIVSAHVVTYGEKAIDTFYVTDLTTAKITDAQSAGNDPELPHGGARGTSPASTGPGRRALIFRQP